MIKLFIELDRLYLNIKLKRIYRVSGFCTHTETSQELVLYVNEKEPSTLWARPKDPSEIGSFFHKFKPIFNDELKECTEPDPFKCDGTGYNEVYSIEKWYFTICGCRNNE